jgi:hypothetical protein
MNPGVLFALFGILWQCPDSTVQAVYINPYKASQKTYLEKIWEKADSGLINAVVIDFKSDYGFLAYPSEIKISKKLGAVKRYLDVDYIIKEAAERGVKVTARIVCFRDNYLSRHAGYGIMDDSGNVWEDSKGISWTNPYKKEVRDYLYAVTEEIVGLGIRSVAFDYIRFPTDGDLGRIALTGITGPRSEPLLSFLHKVEENLGDSVEIGICVFGFAVWHPLLREGQVIEKMGEYIDVLYPMLYPSHFGWSFKREVNEYWRNYWIYYDSVQEALKKLPHGVKVIPFVQAFDYLAETFDSSYVSAQMFGALAAHAHGVALWHAGGDYAISWEPLSWVRNLLQQRAARMSLNNHMIEAGLRYPGTALEREQAQLKIRLKNQTMLLPHSRTDSLPLWQSRRAYLDPVTP